MKEKLQGIVLCFWGKPDSWDPMRVSQVRENLRSNHFDEDFAPEIRLKPAFRRAVKTTETEGRKVTVCGRKDVKAQLDTIVENGSSIERQHEAFWRLDKETETYTGPIVPLEDMRETYQYSDVSRVIRDVMSKDGMGSYALCPSGHIYAVPVGATDYLTRLEAFVVACGLRFTVSEFEDSASSRQTISESLAANLRDELDAHSQAIAEYTAETKPGILRNRQGAVAETRSLIVRLAPFLQAADYALCQAALVDLTAQLETAGQLIAGQRPTSRVLSASEE